MSATFLRMARRRVSPAASTAMVRPLLRTALTMKGMSASILSTRSEGIEMLTRRPWKRAWMASANSRSRG